MPRQKRGERRLGVHIVPTARDFAIVRALCRMRIMRTSDVLRMAFPCVRRDTAMARLRRLYDGGWITVRRGVLNEENVYEIGPSGRRWAETQGLEVSAASVRDSRHHLAVVSAWIELAGALHRNPDLSLLSFAPDWELRRTQAAGLPVVPDGLVMIGHRSDQGGRVLRFVLEIDRATERLRELRRKFATYPAFAGVVGDGWSGGDVGMVVLATVGGERRLESLKLLVEEFWPGWFLVLAAEQWPSGLLDRCLEYLPLPTPLVTRGEQGPQLHAGQQLDRTQGGKHLR